MLSQTIPLQDYLVSLKIPEGLEIYSHFNLWWVLQCTNYDEIKVNILWRLLKCKNALYIVIFQKYC